MKILVTGANGYLGSGIVKTLCNYDVNVIASYRQNYINIDSRANKIAGDIFNINDPYNYFGRPEVLIHAAWTDGFVHNNVSHVENLPKHYNFINAFAQNKIKKIVVIGSMHEVGFFEGSINEQTPCNPQSIYGISKNALRNLVQLMCFNNNILFQWLRGFYIVGNQKNGNSIFSKISIAEEKKEKKFPFTSGQNQWDFLDYDKFCKYVVYTVLQDEFNGIINICSGRPEKLADRVERFIKENNYKIVLDYNKFPDRSYDSKAIWGDDKVLKKIINLYEK